METIYQKGSESLKKTVCVCSCSLGLVHIETVEGAIIDGASSRVVAKLPCTQEMFSLISVDILLVFIHHSKIISLIYSYISQFFD